MMRNTFYFISMLLVLLQACSEPVTETKPPAYDTIFKEEPDTAAMEEVQAPIDTTPPDYKYAQGTFLKLAFTDSGDFMLVEQTGGNVHRFYLEILGNRNPLLQNEYLFKNRTVDIQWLPATKSLFGETSTFAVDSVTKLTWTGFKKTVGAGGDYATPAEAFEQLREGDTLVFLPGIYEAEDRLEIWGQKNVTLMAEEAGTVELLCSNMEESVLWIFNSENLHIHNLKLSHLKPTPDARCYGNVFALDHCKDVTISGCDINGCGAIGVYSLGCTNLNLVKNHIHNNSIWAVQFDGENLLEATSEIPELHFTENQIENNGPDRVEE